MNTTSRFRRAALPLCGILGCGSHAFTLAGWHQVAFLAIPEPGRLVAGVYVCWDEQGADIYISRVRPNGTWSEPEDVPEVPEEELAGPVEAAFRFLAAAAPARALAGVS